ncbi:phytoene desaturase family protein [Dichotomicrobium thermohalophilum]|uniref:Phytoene dehydrogenase-like protein n=1 Tax=Dichotomicrobium thermohalophilum TaxID=933063 RepID=A0A397QCD0_9HYPH|nr:NAD(P)/FAD-dependent oxidoreductase [Dichotomicrobium thermohalophilum]RIA55754.1 phytoene dehydrogenase-like protein [Dichotomicrobium thermohalophilum]
MSEAFDAIVIGSGLGGLTAGALAAKEGRKVLVLERNDEFGGAASTFRRNGLTIEASLHELDGFDAADHKTALFNELGLNDRITTVPIPELHEVRSKHLSEPFVLPSGVEAVKEAASARFPGKRRNIGEFVDLLCDIREAVNELGKQGSAGNWLSTALSNPFRFWSLARNRNATAAEVMDRHFGDEEAVKLALVPNMSYFTEDPARLWFLGFAVAQASYLIGGAHYVKGGSAELASALVAIIEGQGGAARTGRMVTRILTENGTAAGVVHQGDGGSEEARAPLIFGNAAPHVLAEMLPSEQRGDFQRRYAGRPLSHSHFALYLGLREPPANVGLSRYSTFIFPDWMDSARKLPLNADLFAGDPGGRMPMLGVVNYDAIDSGITAEGAYPVSVVGLDSLDNWRDLDQGAYEARRARWTDRIIQELDAHYPGLADAVCYKEMVTARSMQHYLNTPGGAVYGFAAVPPDDQQGFGEAKTPVPGLYLASSYVWYGGFSGAMFGGSTAARAALSEAR